MRAQLLTALSRRAAAGSSVSDRQYTAVIGACGQSAVYSEDQPSLRLWVRLNRQKREPLGLRDYAYGDAGRRRKPPVTQAPARTSHPRTASISGLFPGPSIFQLGLYRLGAVVADRPPPLSKVSYTEADRISPVTHAGPELTWLS